jgi:hypothetical protein
MPAGEACPPNGVVLCTVKVEWDPNQLNPNRVGRMHYRVQTLRKNVSRTAAKYAWLEAGGPRFRVPVDVVVKLYRGRALDDDNAWAALKWVRDVLFKDAITPDDDPRWVRYLPLQQFWARKYQGSEVVVFEVRRRGGSG